MDNKPINLCYEAGKYTFILTLTSSHIKTLKTKKLLGAHKSGGEYEVLILETKNIALYPYDLHRMYNIPDSDFRVHINVPISPDVMYWATPTTDTLHLLIYFEG